MMKRFLLLLVIVYFLDTNVVAQAKNDSFFQPAFIKAKMEKVAAWQINEFEKAATAGPNGIGQTVHFIPV